MGNEMEYYRSDILDYQQRADRMAHASKNDAKRTRG